VSEFLAVAVMVTPLVMGEAHLGAAGGCDNDLYFS